MKKYTLFAALAAALLLCGCAQIKQINFPFFSPEATEAPTTDCPTEQPTTTEALPDAGLSGVTLETPESLFFTPDAPAVFTVTARGVCPDGEPEGGRHCTVKLIRDGAVIRTVEDFVLTEGAEVELTPDYTFGRYLPQQTEGSLIVELDYGEEYIYTTVPVTTLDYPDEYYAMLTNDPYPYAITVFTNKCVAVVYGKDDAGEYTRPAKIFTCSTGIHTPKKGSYSLLRKYEWRALIHGLWGQYATWVTGDILIHSVPYYSNSKDDLWGHEYNRLGRAVSTGCIRMQVCDCKWIFDNCPCGTKVTFYTVNELPEGIEQPILDQMDLESPNAGWDPTDPDPKNPWKPTLPDDSWKELIPDYDEIITANTTLDADGYANYVKTSERFLQPTEEESEEP